MNNIIKILIIGITINLSFSPYSHAQHFSLKGKVKDTQASELSSITVKVLNSNLITQTHKDGTFELEDLPPGLYTLHFSSVGFASKNVKLVLEKDTMISVQLIQSGERLNEAIVNAYKRETDPQKMSSGISVIAAQTVKDQNIWNIKDITSLTPNLVSANPGDNRNVTSIRGVSSSSYNPAVSTYIDGVNQFNLDTYIPYLQDIERIEVLRGPQGSLYGRNAMGGVINIITKQPQNNPSADMEISTGNLSLQRYQLSLKAPLVKDRLYIGASAVFNKFNGFYKNEYDNSHYDRQNTLYGNFYLNYIVNNEWKLSLNHKQVRNRNKGAFPLVMGVDAALEAPYSLNQNTLTEMIDNSTNTSLAVTYHGQALDFTSHTAYQANQRYYDDPIDGDFSPMDAISIINNYGSEWNKVKVFTQELKLSSAAHKVSSINWTIGSYFFFQHNPEKQGTYLGVDAGMMGSPITEATNIHSNKIKGHGLALFGQAGYNLSDRLQLIAGLRYDYEYSHLTAGAAFQAKDQELMITQSDTSASADFNAFTPSLSINYNISEQNNLYGSYSRGFRSGGLTPLSSDDPSAVPLRAYKPEYSNNYEIGSKNTFLTQRLLLNITAFFTQVHDVQVPILVMPDAITLTTNTGSMNTKGVEVEVNSKMISDLEIFGNLGYTHARYTKLSIKDDEENIDLKGNRPIFTPEWTASIGAKYSYRFGRTKDQGLTFNINSKWLGKQYFDLKNTITQDTYGLLNANIGYENRGYSISIWGQNLTEKRYIDYAYNFGAIHLGNPLTYGITLRKSFLF